MCLFAFNVFQFYDQILKPNASLLYVGQKKFIIFMFFIICGRKSMIVKLFCLAMLDVYGS